MKTGLRHILSNTSWIVTERMIKLGIGFFVGVWVARYLGPSGYGILSFGLAWVSLFAAFGQLGLEGIVVREIVAEPDSANEVLGTAFGLRLLGGAVVLVCAVSSYGLFYGWEDVTQVAVIMVLGGAQLFLSIEVVDWWFRSRVEWRYVFRARVSAFAVSTGVKIGLLVFGSTVLWIAAVTLLDAILVCLFLAGEYRFHPNRERQWAFRRLKAIKLLADSWPNILSSIAVILYMRIDQVMIGTLMRTEDVGIYSVAVRLSEVWYVVPLAIVQSVVPSIISSYKADTQTYQARLSLVVRSLFWASVGSAVVVTALGPWIIGTLFGEQYLPAGRVLQIHFWTGAFVAIGYSISQHYLATNRLQQNLYRSVLGLSVNVPLNLLLIPVYGIHGAAIATLCSQIISSFIGVRIFDRDPTAWNIVKKGLVPTGAGGFGFGHRNEE